MIVTAIRVQGQETLMKPRVVLQYNQCCFTKSMGIQVSFFNLIPPTSKSTICDFASAPNTTTWVMGGNATLSNKTSVEIPFDDKHLKH
jgi:hypothetical protein